MQQNIVLPSSRAIREAILRERSNDTFLDNYSTISEFFSRAILVSNRTFLDEDSQKLLLLRASEFQNFSKLNIERNFFTFIQNSSYIFKFFNELSGEKVAIEELDLVDTYEEYSEHIEILIELRARYKELCDKENVIDRMFLPELYEINKAYVKSLGSVLLKIDGFLTNFEIEVIQKCAELIEIKIEFSASVYNQKMQERLGALGFEIKNETINHLNLSTKEIEYTSRQRANQSIEAFTFSQRILQVAFIKYQVFTLLNEGYDSSKIVVMLPDEGFVEMLRTFDTEGNFNFAMGLSIKESSFYQSISSTVEYLDNPSVENVARLNRVGMLDESTLLENYHRPLAEVDFEKIIESYLAIERKNSVKKIVKEELYYFSKLSEHLKESSIKSVLHLFLNRVIKHSLDDVRGGKITVLGLLETRLITYDAVIVVDFNEAYVPRSSEKDLFLNSSIRAKASLPTTVDREALQKHYYSELFRRAEVVRIACVDSSDANVSRFLTQIGIPYTKADDEQYAKILFESSGIKILDEEEIILEHDFTQRPLSSSALRLLLECKRKYYYRYILQVKEHEIAKDLPKEHEIGNIIHNALNKLYSAQNTYDDVRLLKSDFMKILKNENGTTVLQKFQNRQYEKLLEPFFTHEIEHFKKGNIVVHTEKELSVDFEGFKLTGIIDRIDLKSGALSVLDYKTGKYKLYTKRTVDNATDFQLEFYTLLTRSLGTLDSVSFYDLKSGSIVKEELLEEKLELLRHHLSELSQSKTSSFEKCESTLNCQYCAYKYLCKRA